MIWQDSAPKKKKTSLIEKETAFHLILAVCASDKRITCEEEFSDSEDEGEGGRRDRTSYRPKLKKPRTEDDKKDADKGKVWQFSQNSNN